MTLDQCRLLLHPGIECGAGSAREHGFQEQPGQLARRALDRGACDLAEIGGQIVGGPQLGLGQAGRDVDGDRRGGGQR